MSQLSLFASPAPEPQPVDVAFIRKHVVALVRVAKAAQIMPWGPAETAKWERLMPDLIAELPAEEGEKLLAAFTAQLRRLRGEI